MHNFNAFLSAKFHEIWIQHMDRLGKELSKQNFDFKTLL